MLSCRACARKRGRDYEHGLGEKVAPSSHRVEAEEIELVLRGVENLGHASDHHPHKNGRRRFGQVVKPVPPDQVRAQNA